MRRATLANVVVVGLVGLLGPSCGDDLPSPPGRVHGGDRLAIAWYLVDDGGARVPAGLFDRALGASCTPEPWSDGGRYCTPTEAAGTEVVFADGACAVPYGQLLTGVDGVPPVPRYFTRRFELGPSAARARVPSGLYVGTTTLVPEPSTVWVKEGGQCVGPRSPGVQATYYALAGERSPARVYAGVEPLTEELALDVLTADDGLHLPRAWRDRARDVPCALDGDGAPGDARCVPTDAPTASFFRDDACRIPVLAVARSAPTPPLARHLDPVTGCTDTFTLGDETVAPPLYLQARSACAPVVTVPPERFLLLGPPVAMPVVTRVPGASRGRVVPLTIVAGADRDDRVADDALLDTTLNTACRIAPTGVDRGVCAPITDVPIVTYFADDACRVLLDLAAVPAPRCGPVPAYARAAPTPTGPAAFHAIGDLAPGPVFHITTGERCEPFGGLPGIALHAVGPPLVAELATARIVVDAR